MEKPEEVVRHFIQSVEHAARCKYCPSTGMQVPYHGPLASAPPSVMSELDWWVRRMKRALDGDKETPCAPGA